jgi:hypothetical protein
MFNSIKIQCRTRKYPRLTYPVFAYVRSFNIRSTERARERERERERESRGNIQSQRPGFVSFIHESNPWTGQCSPSWVVMRGI